MRSCIFIFLLIPQLLFAQDTTSMAAEYSPNTIWSALIVGGIVIVLLFAGIAVQARWKSRE